MRAMDKKTIDEGHRWLNGLFRAKLKEVIDYIHEGRKGRRYVYVAREY
jgi:hypothetical protein